MKKPKISVIMPVYNVQDFLEDALDSMVNQTFINDIEVLMIDDGSTDNSRHIIEKYALDYDNFYAFHKNNEGLPVTRNYGLKYAKGEYVHFMDSDDFLIFDSYEKMYNCASKNNSDVVTANFFRYNDKRTWTHIISDVVFNSLEEDIPNTNVYEYPNLIWDMSSCNKIYKKEFLDSNNIRFYDGRIIFEDNIFSTDMYSKAKNVYVMKDFTYCWRMRAPDSSISQSHDIERGKQLYETASTVNDISKQINNHDILSEKYFKWLVLDIPFYMSKIKNYSEDEYIYILEGAYNLVNLIPEEYFGKLNNYYKVFYEMLRNKDWDDVLTLLFSDMKKNPDSPVQISKKYYDKFDFIEDAKKEDLESLASKISSDEKDIIIEFNCELPFYRKIENDEVNIIIKNDDLSEIELDSSCIIENKLHIPWDLIKLGVNNIIVNYNSDDLDKSCIMKTYKHKSFSHDGYDMDVHRDKIGYLKLIKRKKNDIDLIIEDIELIDNTFQFKGHSNHKLKNIVINDFINTIRLEYPINYVNENEFLIEIDYYDFLKSPTKKWKLSLKDEYNKINLVKPFDLVTEKYLINIKNYKNNISIDFRLYNSIDHIQKLNNEISSLKKENKKNKNIIKKFKSRKVVKFADKINSLL